jgi:hypothetical protein
MKEFTMKKGFFVFAGLLLLLAMSFTACNNPLDGYYSGSVTIPNNMVQAPRVVKYPPMRMAVENGKGYTFETDIKLPGIGTLLYAWDNTAHHGETAPTGSYYETTSIYLYSGRTDSSLVVPAYTTASNSISNSYSLTAYGVTKVGQAIGGGQNYGIQSTALGSFSITRVDTGQSAVGAGSYAKGTIEVTGKGNNTLITVKLNNGTEWAKGFADQTAYDAALLAAGIDTSSPDTDDQAKWNAYAKSPTFGFGIDINAINIIEGWELLKGITGGVAAQSGAVTSAWGTGGIKYKNFTCTDTDWPVFVGSGASAGEYDDSDLAKIRGTKSSYSVGVEVIKTGKITIQLYGGNLSPETFDFDVFAEED